MTTPSTILLLAFGNPARADDGIGPAVVRLFEQSPSPRVHAMWDYQPAVEYAADLAQHETAIFVDASVSCPEPFSFQRLLGRHADSFSSHDLAPEAVVALARDTLGWKGQAYLLAIRGYQFEPFLESLSDRALANAQIAFARLNASIASDTLDQLVTAAPTNRSDRHGALWQNTIT